MDPLQLSTEFIDAYNRRDAERIRALLADDVVYIRSGPIQVFDPDEIVASYENEWDEWNVDIGIRRTTTEGGQVFVEITATQRDEPHGYLQGATLHRWSNGRMIEYRSYFDPSPAD